MVLISLLLLFSDQVAPSSSGDVTTSMLLETTAGVWYDATGDLISGTVTRGKQNELDQYQAGTANVLLDNDDRKYDPTYAASPLNGHIVPMKRVQLRDTYAGITYPLFAGYADRWTQNRPGPHRGTTSLQATDGFKVLERAVLASSVWSMEMTADAPTVWFRFDDGTDATGLIDSAGGRIATLAGTPDVGVDGLVTRDPSAALRLPTNADGAYTPFAAAPIVTAVPLTLAMIVKGTDVAGAAILRLVDGSGYPVAELSTSGANAFFSVTNSARTTTSVAGSVTVADGSPHLLVGVWDASNNITLYVDGVVDGSPTFAGGTINAATAVTIGGGMPGPLANIIGTVVTVDEVAIFNTAVSSGRVAVWAAARSSPWGGDLTGTRIGRVLDAIDWPAGLRDIDAGQTTLQSAELGMSALEHVQKVAVTEFGDLYMTAGGAVRFEDRNSSVDQPTLYTFSDAPGGDLPITFSNPEISDQDIRNNVTVSRLDGAAQTVSDATSIAAYQTSSYVLDGLYHDADDHSRYLAQFILDGYKQPVERVSSMDANPYRDPANLWPAILRIELTDRIVLNETPQHVVPEVSRTLVVEGISHTFGAKSWSATFNLSENTAATQAYWQLGVAGYSELGETTRLYF